MRCRPRRGQHIQPARSEKWASWLWLTARNQHPFNAPKGNDCIPTIHFPVQHVSSRGGIEGYNLGLTVWPPSSKGGQKDSIRLCALTNKPVVHWLTIWRTCWTSLFLANRISHQKTLPDFCTVFIGARLIRNGWICATLKSQKSIWTISEHTNHKTHISIENHNDCLV